MDTWQARSKGMKGSERTRSLPFMFSKPSGSKGRQRPFEPEAVSAAYEFDQVMLLLPAPLAQ